MKRIASCNSNVVLVAAIISLSLFSSVAFSAESRYPSVVRNEVSAVEKSTESWKGSSRENEFTAGVSTGYGIAENLGGITIRGNVAKKIINRGFVPDINNQVFFELDLGPVVRDGADPFLYSVHLRWDFQYDEQWTFFALGGLAGDYVSDGGFTSVGVYPRVGLGTFLAINDIVAFRADVSHELITVGAAFRF